MRRLPLVPTLIVALAVATMIALGLWQLRRAEWKEHLLAQYAAAASLPALDLDPLIARGAATPPLAYRRVLATCTARDVQPELRGWSSRDGRGGTAYLVPCRPGADGLGGRLLVNLGWSYVPDTRLRLSAEGLIAGHLGGDEPGQPLILTTATATPPLTPSRAASSEDIPNNHLSYAFQWFFFAATAVVIYLLALRRRRAPELPPAP